MILPPLVRLNGRLFGRASVSVYLDGTPFDAVDSAEWSDEKPYEKVFGLNRGGPPLGEVEGQYSSSASIGMYSDAAQPFENALMIKAAAMGGGTDITRAMFTMVFSYAELERRRVVILQNCRVTKRGNAVSNDGSALVDTYDILPRVVLAGGAALVNLLPSL